MMHKCQLFLLTVFMCRPSFGERHILVVVLTSFPGQPRHFLIDKLGLPDKIQYKYILILHNKNLLFFWNTVPLFTKSSSVFYAEGSLPEYHLTCSVLLSIVLVLFNEALDTQ